MLKLDKCFCGKEIINNRNYAKLGDQIIYFCSGRCAEEFMIKKSHEGIIMAIKISEE